MPYPITGGVSRVYLSTGLSVQVCPEQKGMQGCLECVERQQLRNGGLDSDLFQIS